MSAELATADELDSMEDVNSTDSADSTGGTSPINITITPADDDDSAPSNSMASSRYDAISATNERIQTLAQGIRDAAKHSKPVRLYSDLSNELEASGKTLFNYHLCRRLVPELESNLELKAELGDLSHIWEELEENDKEFWAKRTKVAKNALDRLTPTGLANLDILKDANKRTYCKRVRRAIQLVLFNLGREHKNETEDEKISRKIQTLDLDAHTATKVENIRRKSPITEHLVSELLLGSPLPMDQHALASIVPQIVQSLRDCFESCQLRCIAIRIADLRVNYDPDDTSISGIAARLQTATSRSPTTTSKFDSCDPRDRIEWLLHPLAFRRSGLFKDSGLSKAQAMESCPTKWRVCYNGDENYPITKYLGIPDLCTFRPVSEENRDKIINSLIVALEAHVGEQKKLWSKKLSACFKRPGLTSEEYEDLLEQQLHYLTAGKELRARRSKKDRKANKRTVR